MKFRMGGTTGQGTGTGMKGAAAPQSPAATPAGAADGLIRDASIETFGRDVIQESMRVPVVVDFWAAWCGPCRQLGPVLEAQVRKRAGKVKMVKVDTDKNQMLAQQLRIQSLPTVMAFVGGQPVDGFAGALPESHVSQFLDRIIKLAGEAGLGGGAPGGEMDVKAVLASADAALDAGDLAGAMEAFAAAAEFGAEDSDETAIALAGMARCALAAGEAAQAHELLGAIPANKAHLPAVSKARAMATLQAQGTAAAPDQQGLRAAAAAADAAPMDAGAQLDYGLACIEAGALETAIEPLLRSIAADREHAEGAARQKLLTVFDALGPMHPAVKAGRRRLSAVLFA